MSQWFEALLRWTHVLVGVLWLGQFHAFALLGAHPAAFGGAGSTPRLVAAARPRAASWLRWGAAYTWASGLLLTACVYYATLDNLVRREVRFAFRYGLTTEFTLATNEPVVSHDAGVAISLALLVLGFLAYEVVWKALGRSERAAAAVSLALLALALFFLGRVLTGRALFLHAGALLGTIMAANVWVRIGPALGRMQKAASGPAPGRDAAAEAQAALRSRHNAYLSAPVLFAMISNHYPALYDREDGWAILVGVVLAGWGMAWWLYDRPGRAATGSEGSPGPLGAPGSARPAGGKV